jgi:hypothetical protein
MVAEIAGFERNGQLCAHFDELDYFTRRSEKERPQCTHLIYLTKYNKTISVRIAS